MVTELSKRMRGLSLGWKTAESTAPTLNQLTRLLCEVAVTVKAGNGRQVPHNEVHKVRLHCIMLLLNKLFRQFKLSGLNQIKPVSFRD